MREMVGAIWDDQTQQYYLSDDKKCELLVQLDTAPASVKPQVLKMLDKPLQFGRVHYYYYVPRWIKDKTNHHVGLFFGYWPERNLRAKGITIHRPFANRLMTVDEVIDEWTRWRMYSVNYNSWQKLLEDDSRVGVPDSFIEELTSYRDMYKLKDVTLF